IASTPLDTLSATTGRTFFDFFRNSRKSVRRGRFSRSWREGTVRHARGLSFVLIFRLPSSEALFMLHRRIVRPVFAFSVPGEIAAMSPEPETPREGGNVEKWIAQARAGSAEALGRLLDMCRRYLLLVANQELAPKFRAKVAPS